MEKEPIHIKFQNRQNPHVDFDLIRLEKLFNRKGLDHSPFQLHLVEFYMIILIEAGHGKHLIDFTEYSCQKGTLLTIRKDQIHKFVKSPQLKGSMLLFTNEFLLSYLEEVEAQKTLQLFNDLLGSPKIQLTASEYQEIFQLVKDIYDEYIHTNDDYSIGIIRSVLHILVVKLFRIKSSRSELNFSRKYVKHFIAFQKLVEEKGSTSVKEYAHLMGLSTKTLNTITQSIVNKTAKAFVDEICTMRIKRLLINTDHSIKEIAYASGFEETTNFYKYFKRQSKMTPEQFRSLY